MVVEGLAELARGLVCRLGVLDHKRHLNEHRRHEVDALKELNVDVHVERNLQHVRPRQHLCDILT